MHVPIEGNITSNINIGLYSGHILTLLLFSVALVLIIKELIYLHNSLIIFCKESKSVVKATLYASLCSSMVVTIVFIVLQLDWILNNHNEAVGNITSFTWLIFDTALGVFFICFTVFTTGVRSKLEYLDRLENIVKNRYQYDCITNTSSNTPVNTIKDDDGKVIKESVEESKEGLRVLRKRIIMKKDDSVFNPDNGCRK